MYCARVLVSSAPGSRRRSGVNAITTYTSAATAATASTARATAWRRVKRTLHTRENDASFT